jgi:hypothetical protein
MLSKADLMKFYTFHNDTANQMRHRANDHRILGETAETEALCKSAAPHRDLAEQYYTLMMRCTVPN